MRDVVRAGAWAGFHELVTDLGGNPEDILLAAQVSPEQLQRADVYLPVDRLIACMEDAAHRLRRPDFGLLWGEGSRPRPSAPSRSQ